MKDALPKLIRVGLLRGTLGGLGGEVQLKEIRPAALALKLKLEEIETQPSLESAFQIAKQKQVGAIMTTTAVSGIDIGGRCLFARAEPKALM